MLYIGHSTSKSILQNPTCYGKDSSHAYRVENCGTIILYAISGTWLNNNMINNLLIACGPYLKQNLTSRSYYFLDIHILHEQWN